MVSITSPGGALEVEKKKDSEKYSPSFSKFLNTIPMGEKCFSGVKHDDLTSTLDLELKTNQSVSLSEHFVPRLESISLDLQKESILLIVC